MKGKRLRTLQAILFLPALALFAAVLYAAIAVLVHAGNGLVFAWAWLLVDVLGMPRLLAAAFALVLVPLTVLAVSRRLFRDPHGAPKTHLKA